MFKIFQSCSKSFEVWIFRILKTIEILEVYKIDLVFYTKRHININILISTGIISMVFSTSTLNIYLLIIFIYRIMINKRKIQIIIRLEIYIIFHVEYEFLYAHNNLLWFFKFHYRQHTFF